MGVQRVNANKETISAALFENMRILRCDVGDMAGGQEFVSWRVTSGRLRHVQTYSPGGRLYSLLCCEIYEGVIAFQQLLRCPHSPLQ